ncbi:MAG: hypothetical protein KIS91_20435 [Anaerolineae bacterium]|nr:hypothetical protein [Anaerolineae bacterium]
MDSETLSQLRGAKDLIQEGVDAGAVAVADVQRELAHRVYAILTRLPVIGLPARGIESIQQAITDGVYGSLRGVNHGLGSVADYALDQWTARLAEPRAATPPLEQRPERRAQPGS